jgi:hypothetical protein
MPERTPLHSTFVYMMCLTSMQAAISFMHSMGCEVVHQGCMQEFHQVVRDVLGAHGRGRCPHSGWHSTIQKWHISIETRTFYAKGGSDGKTA